MSPQVRKRRDEQKNEKVEKNGKVQNGKAQNGHAAKESLPVVEAPQPGYFYKRRLGELKQQYYKDQDELEDLYKRDEAVLAGQVEIEEEERDSDIIINRFIFYLTISIVIANTIASYLSGSLSILSTLIDAAMDLSTSTIMSISLKKAQEVDSSYPRGKEQLEIVGVILSSVIMGFSNIFMIIRSVQAILDDTVDPHMTLPTIIILLTGCSIKFVIMVICYKRGNSASLCLAMDLRNDILMGSVAIVCAWIGDAYWKYTDALGAILVCTYIAHSWFRNTLDQIPSITGVAADRHHQSRILNIVLKHDKRIQKIDHVMTYHYGAKALVELHIVMDENLPLRITHDISHTLEEKLNKLEFVQRSFIHCDYTCDGDH